MLKNYNPINDVGEHLSVYIPHMAELCTMCFRH